MEAGGELDALVAEKVMGWRWLHDGLGNMAWYEGLHDTGWGDGGDAGRNRRAWAPATDIAAAWQVVEKMRSDGWLVSLREMPDGFPYLSNDPVPQEISRHKCICEMEYKPSRNAEDCRKRFTWPMPIAFTQSTPFAICLAALRAVGVEV